MYRLSNRGLGAPTDYGSYMAACTGPNLNCQPRDEICIANQQNITDACQSQYVTDPNSPHNTATPTSDPTPLNTDQAAYLTNLAQAGGSIQLAEKAANETVPQGVTSSEWWSAPGATVAAASPATTTVSSSVPATKTAAPYSASSVPATQAASSYSASATPTETASTTGTTTGFSLDSIPWWGWALAAGAGLLALKK